MANTYNSNREQLTTTTYTPTSFSNPNSSVFPSKLTINYFNRIMKLSILPKKEQAESEAYASYDRDKSVDAYLSATQAKMLHDLILYMKNTENVHNVCIEVKAGLLTVSDGSDLGVSAPCITIRSADEAGNIKTVTYEMKTTTHKGAYNYNADDNSYSDYMFKDIELDMLLIVLNEYVKASSYAIAASVMEAGAWNRDRVQKTIAAIADKVGAQNHLSGGGSNKNYNSKTFLSGGSGGGMEASMNPPTTGNSPIPREYEASTFDDIANAMRH